VPYVIEPRGPGSTGPCSCSLMDAYAEDEAPDAKGKLEKRTVLLLDPRLAPVKAAVLPLSRNADLSPKARDLAARLRKRWNTDFDDASAIGRRYRRQDEIWHPVLRDGGLRHAHRRRGDGPGAGLDEAGAGPDSRASRPTCPNRLDGC